MKPNHVLFSTVIVALNLVIGLGGLNGCQNSQSEAKRAEAREILQTSEYLTQADPYMMALAETVKVSISTALLEEKGTFKEQIELLNDRISHTQLQRGLFARINTPPQYQTLRDLNLESFDSTEQVLDMLLTTFQRALLPARSQSHWAERFEEDRLLTVKLLDETTAVFGRARDERSRLGDQLQERLNALGVTKTMGPSTESEGQIYLIATGSILGSIADARDDWRRLSAERSQAIASLARHQDPVDVRNAIEAEDKALERLYNLVSGSLATLTQLTPPRHCQKLHDLTIEAMQIEKQAFKDMKASWSSEDQGDWERGTLLLVDAAKIKGQIDAELPQCIRAG